MEAEKSDYFLALASYHGVAPLVYQQLKSLFTEGVLFEMFQKQYAYIARRNMFMTAELLRIRSLFLQANIEILAFKGPALARYAYGDITLRQFGDIDVLVHPEDIPAVMRLMQQEGYVPDVNIPKEDAAHYYALLTTIGFDNPASKMRIEIHWELLSGNYAVAWKSDALWKEVEMVEINRQMIPTLRFEDHLLYLCLHGSKHLFERLEWVCDIDRSIRSRSTIDWQYIISLAKDTGVVRMLLLGLSLAKDIYGTPLPDTIEEKMKNDRVLPRLKEKIMTLCYSKESGKKIDKGYFFTVMQMRERFSDRMCFAWQALFATQFNDINYIKLPKYLRSLYPFVRLFRLIQKYITK